MRIAVIGTGYVGLVTGVCLAETGNKVICVDNNQEKLERFRKGDPVIYEKNLAELLNHNLQKNRIEFTDDLKYAVENSEIIFFCLPTPQGEDGAADLKHVLEVADQCGEILNQIEDKSYKIFVNKSTVPVGTAELVRQKIKAKAGDYPFDVVSNPEFLREGFAVEDFMKPDRIVIGTSSEKAREMMKTLYEPFVRSGNPIYFMDEKSAEITKYAANCFLATKITFMNEIANYCEKVGANVDMVRIAMGADNRIGKRFLFPGIGYGGSCFPKDIKALQKSFREVSVDSKVIDAVIETNEKQKLVLIDKILKHFNQDIKGKRFALWGLAFKPETDDVREAPAFKIIDKILELGGKIAAYDPEAMDNTKRVYGDKIEYAQDALSACKDADALIIATEWNEFRTPDFEAMKNLMKEFVIFDGRNVFDNEKAKKYKFVYYSIGRKPVLKEDLEK
ncbi:MAG: UDP-glucose/GDP-mannose dehydrogenase family protein [Ignavibacteria bacterium]